MRKWKVAASYLLALCLLSTACNTKSTQQKTTDAAPKFQISPPIPGLEAQFQEFEIDPSKDQVLSLENGGHIRIPAGSLVDTEGNPVEGLVNIKYREYHDAVDAMLSGIPMDYKAKGIKETMQTAGMFEIRGEQDGEALAIAEGKGIEVKIASYEAGDNYSFFQLDDENGNWDILDKKEEITVNEKRKIIKDKIKTQSNVMAYPLNSKYFAFNYDAVLDVMFKDNYRKIYENRDNPGVKAKAKRYGMSWMNAYSGDEINFKGVSQPSALMLWKQVSGKRFPKWLHDKNREYANLTHLYGNVYEMEIESKDGKQHYKGRIEAIMPLNALFKFSPEYLANNYQAVMAKVEKEMERLKKEAAVFRSMEIQGFGIYNYDKFLKIDDRIDILAKFEVDESVITANELFELDMVFCLPEDNKTLIKLPKEDWGKVALLPNTKTRFIGILPDAAIGIYSAESYMALDFDGLRKEDEPTVVFKLIKKIDKLANADDLKKELDI